MTLKLKWKIIIPVIAIFALVAGYLQIKKQTPNNLQEQQEEQEQNAPATETIASPVATGNIDDTIDALLQDSSNEVLMSQDESSDIDLINADSQAISDFGQSYNENEF